jgi:hypothetical protein
MAKCWWDGNGLGRIFSFILAQPPCAVLVCKVHPTNQFNRRAASELIVSNYALRPFTYRWPIVSVCSQAKYALLLGKLPCTQQQTRVCSVCVCVRVRGSRDCARLSQREKEMRDDSRESQVCATTPPPPHHRSRALPPGLIDFVLVQKQKLTTWQFLLLVCITAFAICRAPCAPTPLNPSVHSRLLPSTDH